MAEIVDDVGEIEAVEQEIEQTKEPEKAKEPEAKPSIPEKFRGKAIEDVIKAYEDAEKKASRLGNEVHEVRQLADELLKQNLTKKAEVEKPTEIDFFENPQAAIKQAIASSPEIKNAAEYAEQYRKAQALQMVATRHPDFQQVVMEPDFVEFAKESPERIAMFNRASNYDANAGIELLNNYKLAKEYKAIKAANITTQVSESEKEVRQKAISAASVDTSGTNESSKKIFRRADLLKMRIRDPDRYAALADSGELASAYEEGRVR